MRKQVIQFGASGGSFLDDPRYGFDAFVVGCQGGAVTLTSSITIGHVDTPIGAYAKKVFWGGGFTLNGNSITIFGKALTQQEALRPCEVTGVWDPWTNGFKAVVNTDDGIGQGTTEIDLSASLAGGSVNIDIRRQSQKVILSGTGTLLGNLTINLVTSGVIDGDEVEIFYDATLTLGAFTLTVASNPVTSAQALKTNWLVVGLFDKAWVTRVIGIDITASKTAVYGRRLPTAGSMEPLVFSETLDHAVGYSKETNEVVTNFAAIRYIEVSYTKTQIEAMHTTPLIFIPKSIDPAKSIMLFDIPTAEISGVTTPYTIGGAQGVRLLYSGATALVRAEPEILKSTVNRILSMDATFSVSADTAATKILRNADLMVNLLNAATLGDGTLTLRAHYRYVL